MSKDNKHNKHKHLVRFSIVTDSLIIIMLLYLWSDWNGFAYIAVILGLFFVIEFFKSFYSTD